MIPNVASNLVTSQKGKKVKQNLVKLLLGCCCVMTLVGCGSKTATQANDSGSSATKKEITQTQQNNRKDNKTQKTNETSTNGKDNKTQKANETSTSGKDNKTGKTTTSGKTSTGDKSDKAKETGKKSHRNLSPPLLWDFNNFYSKNFLCFSGWNQPLFY